MDNLRGLIDSMVAQAACLQDGAVKDKKIQGLETFAAHSEGMAAGLMLAARWLQMVVGDCGVVVRCNSCKFVCSSKCPWEEDKDFSPLGCTVYEQKL